MTAALQGTQYPRERALYVTQNFVTLLFGPCLVCSYFVYVMTKRKKNQKQTPKKNKKTKWVCLYFVYVMKKEKKPKTNPPKNK
jgi:hypothetical protein